MGLMKYQFDNHANGDIYSSPDNRDPEDLRKIHEMLESGTLLSIKRRRKLKSDMKESALLLSKLRSLPMPRELDAACECPVKVGVEAFRCPVLRTINGSGRAKSWAVIRSKQCFPVVLNLEIDAFCLDEPGCAVLYKVFLRVMLRVIFLREMVVSFR